MKKEWQPTQTMVRFLARAAANHGWAYIPGRKWRVGKALRAHGLMKSHGDWGDMQITDAGRALLP